VWVVKIEKKIMSDEIDLANTNSDLLQDAKIKNLRAQAAAIPAGEPGECNECGDQMLRLVNGVCAPCREDLEKLQGRF
jgi:hypothetical protein